MAKDWETQFQRWSTAPGKTEQERCENAEGAIRNAIRADSRLSSRNIRVFTHGSYRNRVNVRQDSDVDVGVLCFDTFYPDYPEGTSAKTYNHEDATYSFSQFKNDLESALVNYFGRDAVTRGNKAFDLHETSYHVEADVAPFFEHRRYSATGSYLSGVALRPDSGYRIINWPEQHYDNGVAKNRATTQRYKGGVRILKALRNEMDEAGSLEARAVTGFLLECLVWNSPNSAFDPDTWKERIRFILAHLWINTATQDKCDEWGEVSELKYLFRGSGAQLREPAHQFLGAAWNFTDMK